MRESERLADLVERVIDGDCWHGSNVLTLIRGLSPEDAATEVVPGGHSVWAIVLHMTAWAAEVSARIGGASAGDPHAGDWPAVPDAGMPAWTAAVEALAVSHRALAAEIRRVGDAALDVPVTDHRDHAAGTGLSKYVTTHGLVHHTSYHAGQIALLRRALASRR